MEIKLLTQKDWKSWRELRLEALQISPENFGSSYDEELNWSDTDFQKTFNTSYIFGAFLDKNLVASVGYYCLNLLKTKHRGIIWGMYTQPKHQGKGIARALIQTVVAHAVSRVIQLHLTCVTTNFGAIAFYQKQGFKIYGTEPRALKIEDRFFDEYLMILDLKKYQLEKT